MTDARRYYLWTRMLFPRLVPLVLLNVVVAVGHSSNSTDGCIDSDVDLRAKKDAFVRTVEAQCRLLGSSSFFCMNVRLLVSITSEPFWCTQRQFGLDDVGDEVGSRRRRRRKVKREADEEKLERAGDGSLDNLVDHLNWDIFHINKMKEKQEIEKTVKVTGLRTNEVDTSEDHVRVPPRNETAVVEGRNRTYVVYPVSPSFREELFDTRNDSVLDRDPPNATDPRPDRTSNPGNVTSAVTSWPGNIKKIKWRPTLHHGHAPPLTNGGVTSVVNGYQLIQNLVLGVRVFLQQWNLLKSWISPGMLVRSARQLAEWMGLMPSAEGRRMTKRKKKKAATIMKVVMALKMMKIVAISFLTAKLLAFKAMATATAALTLALSITFKKLPGGGGGGGGGGGDKKAKTVVVSHGGGGDSKGVVGGGGWPEGWSAAEDIWDSGGGSAGGGGGWDGGGASVTKGVMDGGWKADRRRRKGMESRWRLRQSTTEQPYDLTVAEEEEEFHHR